MRLLPVAMLCLTALAIAGPQSARAAVMTNGALTVDIRSNGAINAVVFGGTDFFNAGTAVSDYGFQVGTDTGTFRINTTTGTMSQPVSVSDSNVVTGTFTAGGANVAFTRSYSLVPGQNVLRISTTFTNNGADLDLRYFDAFDPDQGFNLGQGNVTLNDVFPLADGLVGQARIDAGGHQHTVIVGSLDPRVTVGAGTWFSIVTGEAVNFFFASPGDADDGISDRGLQIGLETLLASGGSTTFVVDLAFGLTPAEAQAAFIAANTPAADPPTATPEPASLALWGIGAVGLAFGRARRRREAA